MRDDEVPYDCQGGRTACDAPSCFIEDATGAAWRPLAFFLVAFALAWLLRLLGADLAPLLSVVLRPFCKGNVPLFAFSAVAVFSLALHAMIRTVGGYWSVAGQAFGFSGACAVVLFVSKLLLF